jgi:hypothetical protein
VWLEKSGSKSGSLNNGIESPEHLLENIMSENEERLLRKVFDLLQKQQFADWYNEGDFDHWLSGQIGAPDEEEIFEQFKDMI